MARKKKELPEDFLKAIADIESKNDAIKDAAELAWKIYVKYRNAGFNDQQAMTILLEMIHMGTGGNN